jgi:hypothetical protein
MFGRPKFSPFRSGIEPSPSTKTNGDRLRLLPFPNGNAGEERKANMRRACFFATAAVLFVLADQLKNPSDSVSTH